jgi:hypothetical protein
MFRRNLVPPSSGSFPPKCRFLQEPHGVTSQKTPFFIVTTVTCLLTCFSNFDLRSPVGHIYSSFMLKTSGHISSFILTMCLYHLIVLFIYKLSLIFSFIVFPDLFFNACKCNKKWRQGLDRFYKYVKRLKGNRENIVAIRDVNGRLIFDSIEKANPTFLLLFSIQLWSQHLTNSVRQLMSPSPFVLKSLKEC